MGVFSAECRTIRSCVGKLRSASKKPGSSSKPGLFLLSGDLFLLWLGDVLGPIEEEGHRVEDAQGHDAGVGESPQDHGVASSVAEGDQDHDQDLDEDGEADAENDVEHRPPGKPPSFGDLPEVVVHDDDVAGFDGGIASESSHADSDVAGQEGGRVVDSISDEADLLPLHLFLQHLLSLLKQVAVW